MLEIPACTPRFLSSVRLVPDGLTSVPIFTVIESLSPTEILLLFVPARIDIASPVSATVAVTFPEAEFKKPLKRSIPSVSSISTVEEREIGSSVEWPFKAVNASLSPSPS